MANDRFWDVMDGIDVIGGWLYTWIAGCSWARFPCKVKMIFIEQKYNIASLRLERVNVFPIMTKILIAHVIAGFDETEGPINWRSWFDDSKAYETLW